MSERGLDKYFTSNTVSGITVTSEAGTFPEETFRERLRARRTARDAARKEMEAMSQAMIQEQGLLNHAQAGLLLDVSTKRVGELVRLGKLRRFDFMGRTYVSMREVKERREADVKAGRPKRGVLKRMLLSLEAAAETDPIQRKHGGYAGRYYKQGHDKRKKK